MKHRSVAGTPPGEVVPLHDTLESLAAARADDVDALAKLNMPAGVDIRSKV